jgi:hypothetical protein
MSETLDGEVNTKQKDTKNKDDLICVGKQLLDLVNVKMCLFLFMLGIILFSDVFINTILINFSDSVDGECTTTKGTIIQLMLLIVGYVIIDILIKCNVL